MKITLAGKAHLEGKSSKKTGKPYNVNVIHYLGRAYGVDGMAAQTDMLDGVKYPYDTLVVGREYIIEHDCNGKLLIFEPADGKSAPTH